MNDAGRASLSVLDRASGRINPASAAGGWSLMLRRRIGVDARIVVLTGAGISVESGLPTFRGKDGLWEGQRFEEVATPEAFARDPDHVHRFYNHRRRQLRDASVRPNAAHLALAELERRWQG